MQDFDFNADCENCAALCCVSHAIDKSDFFAFDKPAGVPCKNLSIHSQCKIHDGLEEKGCKGCKHYTCYGAGQYVTQELFEGHSWQESADILEPMMRAFLSLKQIHENLFLLETAKKLPLNNKHLETLRYLKAKLVPEGGWKIEDLSKFDVETMRSDVRSFLNTLRDVASQQ